MPVVTQLLGGKSEQHVEPMRVADMSRYHHTHRLTYTLTVKTTPFFDAHKGWMYNARSAGELLMPIAMLLGTYLGISAHYEFQSHLGDFDDDEIGRANADIFGIPDVSDRGEIAAAAR